MLYQEAADFDLTSELRGKAKRELDRRFAATGSYKPTAKSPTSGLIKRKARKRVFSAASINRRMLAEPTLQGRAGVIESELDMFSGRNAAQFTKREMAYAIDSTTGKQILKKTGGRSAVSFTEKEAEKMRHSILTHNHPTGASFSLEDVVFAHENELAEIRVVAMDRTYSLMPPKGTEFFVPDRETVYNVIADYSDWYSDAAQRWEAGIIKQGDFVREGREFWKITSEATGVFRYEEIFYK